jgi:uncharacterized protein YyaL (SSP411 family)
MNSPQPHHVFRVVSAFGLVLLAFAAPSFAGPSTGPAIAWQAWSDGQFAQAKREHRFVLLDLEAVWCHWCHVMDDTTYADPAVQKLIEEKFIPVRVDQDSRPDISNRYEDYGWPATVVFDSAGHPIVKRRGYLPPKEMASMLQAIIDDPTPGPSIHTEIKVVPAAKPALSSEEQKQLVERLKSDYDQKNDGWYGAQKYIDPNVVEYCLIDGDEELRQMAIKALHANLKLIDPVWGGVDQYSTNGDWDHPHFEKIMSTQADDLRIYAQAYLATGDANYLKAAEKIHRYLREFLTSPDGAFYVSQDADLHDGEESDHYYALNDADRRKLGIPRVDRHEYARENGWAIQSFCMLYAATDDRAVLDQAIAAAKWIIKNRSLGEGGFSHDEKDLAGPYLGDTLAMGRAFLALYETTADGNWLVRAQDCMKFMEAHFHANVPHDGGAAAGAMGLATAVAPADSILPSPDPELDENVDSARFANLLFAYTGVSQDRDTATAVMRYLASPEITAPRGWAVGGILLANRELGSEPLHVTVVGAKSDPLAMALFATALRVANQYKRIDWYDPAHEKLPNSDVEYPSLARSAAYVCTGTACSAPINLPSALAVRLRIPADLAKN